MPYSKVFSRMSRRERSAVDPNEWQVPLAVQPLVDRIHDYQLTHGSLIKDPPRSGYHTTNAHPIGCTLHPTVFPANLFKEANELRHLFSYLYAAVADDDDFLYQTLRPNDTTDPLVSRLWAIHESVLRGDGFARDYTLMIARSDYMLHQAGDQSLALKQVEFNSFFATGACHSEIIARLHTDLNATGELRMLTGRESSEDARRLPQNHNIHNFARTLSKAHSKYEAKGNLQRCILMVAQENNFNVADERPIQEAFQAMNPSIPCFRVLWGPGLLQDITINEQRELIYTQPESGIPWVVSVVYLRAGIAADEYDEFGFTLRMTIERSRAITCPSVSAQLAGMKSVQRALCDEVNLSKFLPPGWLEQAQNVFMDMHALGDDPKIAGTANTWGRYLIECPEVAEQFVLKPNRDGGGHNVYGSDVVTFLHRLPESKWSDYSLQRKIKPPSVSGMLMSQAGLYEGDVISELGIFGGIIWRQEKQKRTQPFELKSSNGGSDGSIEERAKERRRDRAASLFREHLPSMLDRYQPKKSKGDLSHRGPSEHMESNDLTEIPPGQNIAEKQSIRDRQPTQSPIPVNREMSSSRISPDLSIPPTSEPAQVPQSQETTTNRHKTSRISDHPEVDHILGKILQTVVSGRHAEERRYIEAMVTALGSLFSKDEQLRNDVQAEVDKILDSHQIASEGTRPTARPPSSTQRPIPQRPSSKSGRSDQSGESSTRLYRPASTDDDEGNTSMALIVRERTFVEEDMGWTFKTKRSSINEMSVVKGYGCFDCPLLAGSEHQWMTKPAT